MQKSIQIRDLLSYGVVALPLAFAGIPLYVYVPDFYATEYGVSLTTLALALLLLRVVDAIQDPLIGYVSDYYTHFRIHLIVYAGIALIVSFMLLFIPILQNPVIQFIIVVFIATTSFSIMSININAIGSLWSRHSHEKTIIVSYRECFSIVGLLLAVTLPYVLQNHFSKLESYLYISGLLAIIIVVSLFVFCRWYRRTPLALNQNSVPSQERFQWPYSILVKPFFITYAVSMLASAIPVILVVMFIRDRLALEMSTGLFLCVYFLSSIIGMAGWVSISRVIGKYQAWAVAMAMSVMSFIWAYFLGAGDFWPYMIICLLSGVAFGAELILPASILSDHIQEAGEDGHAAMQFGIMALLMKLSLAVAAALTLPYLDSVGFVAGGSNSEDVLHALSFSYALLPTAIKMIAIYLLWRGFNEKNTNIFNRSIDYA